MKYAAYSEYKTSNIGWVRDFPAHWELKRLKYVANRAEVKVEADEDNPLPYIGLEQVEPWTGRLIDLDDDLVPTGASNRFAAGDTLFGKLRPYLAKACNVDFDGLCSSELLVLRGKTYDCGFLLYQLLSHGFINLVDSSTYGSKMPRASWDFIGICELPLPPLDEQQTIARFLDAKTAQIDALVAKKHQLIARLKEKRQALIARTVTRGLPPEAAKAAGLEPNPEMKDSGVDWLGEIPSHWECKPIKHLGRIGNGSTPARDNSDYWEDGSFPWLNSSMVNEDSVSNAEEFVTASALRECHLPIIKPPAILIGITGQGRTRGMAATLLIEATINQHVAYVEPMPHLVNVHFLRRVFDNAYLYLRSESDGGGSTKGAITCDQIANLNVPLPPQVEQQAIAAYLDREITQLEALATKVESAITRLTEYRQALITSAVTGKIDVRGLA